MISQEMLEMIEQIYEKTLILVGDMGTIIAINKEKKIKYYSEKAYSITYHAVQGKTITQNIALNLARLFDKNMKYV